MSNEEILQDLIKRVRNLPASDVAALREYLIHSESKQQAYKQRWDALEHISAVQRGEHRQVGKNS